MKKLATALVFMISACLTSPSFAAIELWEVCGGLSPSYYLPSNGYWVLTDKFEKYDAIDSSGNACSSDFYYPGSNVYANLESGCVLDSIVACNGQIQPGWEAIGRAPCSAYSYGTIIRRTTNSEKCCPKKTYYKDNDGDGYGTSTTKTSCSRPSGYADKSGDCNDNDKTVHSKKKFYEDNDQDSYGSSNYAELCLSTAPSGRSTKSGDCNDNDKTVHSTKQFYIDADKDGLGSTTTRNLCQNDATPGNATNSNDCDDSNSSIKGPLRYYADKDTDGYGSNDSITSCSRTAPKGYSTNNSDCNDNDNYSHPGASWYRDMDGDNFGDASDAIVSCMKPVGYISNNEDINDEDDEIGPEVRKVNCNDHVDMPEQRAVWTGGADAEGIFTQEFNYDEEEYEPAIEDACEWGCERGPYNLPLYYVWNGKCVFFSSNLEMSKVEWLTDRPGNDYKKTNNDPSLSFTDCQNACEKENKKCVAWTYLAAGVQGTNPVCYLKNKWGQPRKMMKAFSGVTMISPEYKTIEQRSDRPGSDYYSFTSSGSVIACQNQCMIEDRCMSWTTLDNGDGTLRCWLKSSVPTRVNKTPCMSGLK